MPTWWMGLPKNTRSPGWSSERATRVPELICIPDECGRETPACAQAHMVRPEQSKASGPAAAHTYGLPSFDLAASTATAARPLTGTFAGGGSTAGGGEDGALRGSA